MTSSKLKLLARIQRGRVLPIGGLKEKLLAACQCRFTAYFDIYFIFILSGKCHTDHFYMGRNNNILRYIIYFFYDI